MTPADRTRLYRQRVKAGRFIAPVEIDGDDLATLERLGLLSSSDSEHPAKVADAVRRCLKKHVTRHAGR